MPLVTCGFLHIFASDMARLTFDVRLVAIQSQSVSKLACFCSPIYCCSIFSRRELHPTRSLGDPITTFTFRHNASIFYVLNMFRACHTSARPHDVPHALTLCSLLQMCSNCHRALSCFHPACNTDSNCGIGSCCKADQTCSRKPHYRCVHCKSFFSDH